jgi:hypothetical protein
LAGSPVAASCFRERSRPGMSRPRQPSARPGAPWPASASAAISSAGASGKAKRKACSIAPRSSGPRRRSRQRERMVGSSRSGLWLTRKKTVLAGGSSRLLSRALAAAGSRSSIESMTTARRFDTLVVEARLSRSERICATRMLRAGSSPLRLSLGTSTSFLFFSQTSRSTSLKSGCASAATQRAAVKSSGTSRFGGP